MVLAGFLTSPVAQREAPLFLEPAFRRPRQLSQRLGNPLLDKNNLYCMKIGGFVFSGRIQFPLETHSDSSILRRNPHILRKPLH